MSCLLRRSRGRIPSVRPSRPPDPRTQSRAFTRHSKLRIISTPAIRPQLIFLSPLVGRAHGGPLGQWQFPRLMTTENKKLFKEQARLGVKFTIAGVVISALFLFESYVITHELLEREYPTPHEWSIRSRCNYHSAKGMEHPNAKGREFTDWGHVGVAWRSMLKRLEDPSIEGADLTQQVEGGIYIPGAGEAGYDISAKAEPWRRGYYETLMGCAKAAEHLEGQVLDITRNQMFSPKCMIGPSNPEPAPLPPWDPAPPLEENCVPAFESPQTFYSKILTTKGFTSKQQVQAAIAYGEWLDFKGRHDAAEEAFRWGLDIACAHLPDPSSVIDSKTSILKSDAPLVTENVLAAATAFATHQAQTTDTVTALPILLSVLRARRSQPADLTPKPREQTFAEKYQTSQKSDIGAFFAYCRAIADSFSKVPYPAAEKSGDQPFLRTVDTACDEASIMTYIGEILFASGPDQYESGIRWTKDAVELAHQVSKDSQVTEQTGRKTIKCIDVGLTNWSVMVETMQRQAELQTYTDADKGSRGWSSWFTGGSATPDQERVSVESAEKQRLLFENIRRTVGNSHLRNYFEELDTKQPLWGSYLLSWY